MMQAKPCTWIADWLHARLVSGEEARAGDVMQWPNPLDKTGLVPLYDQAAIDAAVAAERVRCTAEIERLRAVALHHVSHVYEGDCPDLFDSTRRDANCPACKILGA